MSKVSAVITVRKPVASIHAHHKLFAQQHRRASFLPSHLFMYLAMLARVHLSSKAIGSLTIREGRVMSWDGGRAASKDKRTSKSLQVRQEVKEEVYGR